MLCVHARRVCARVGLCARMGARGRGRAPQPAEDDYLHSKHARAQTRAGNQTCWHQCGDQKLRDFRRIREYINPGKFAHYFFFRVDRFPKNDLKEMCKLTRIYVLAYAKATSLSRVA